MEEKIVMYFGLIFFSIAILVLMFLDANVIVGFQLRVPEKCKFLAFVVPLNLVWFSTSFVDCVLCEVKS
jgi:hypothetical protein